MSGNLDFIKELGIGSEDTTLTEDVDSNLDTDTTESDTDLSLDSEDATLTDADSKSTTEDTDPDVSEELRKQIEGLEKRIRYKDEYINELRNKSKAKEQSKSDEGDVQETEDFWDDPEKAVKKMQQTIKIQQMQIQETVYANTVDDYWKTVTPEALQEAVATDTDFSNTFNQSAEPYKVAYEYLTKKTKARESEAQALRDKIRQEIIDEMGIKKEEKKKGVPNINNLGGTSGGSKKSDVPDDGFASVFGQSY